MSKDGQVVMDLCPNCREENPPSNSYCGSCGAALNEGTLVVSRPGAIEIGERPLATPQLKALALTVAVSVVTLLAEASLVYLQRRVSAMERPSFSPRRKRESSAEAETPARLERPRGRVITVVGERVVEEKRWGRPVRRVVERFAWRGESSK